jgi:hypothetical protein
MPLAVILVEILVGAGAGLWGWASWGAAKASGALGMIYQGLKSGVMWCVSAGLLVVAAQELVKVAIQRLAN